MPPTITVREIPDDIFAALTARAAAAGLSLSDCVRDILSNEIRPTLKFTPKYRARYVADIIARGPIPVDADLTAMIRELRGPLPD